LIPRFTNYKTKEAAAISFLIDYFEFDIDDVLIDRKIEGGCSNRRPDMFIDCLTHVICVEVDENKHAGYDPMCDNRRSMEISQDIAHRPLIILRFNPDGYMDLATGERKKSCWYIDTTTGVMSVVDEEEWQMRLETLADEIEKWMAVDDDIENLPCLNVVYLFYD